MKKFLVFASTILALAMLCGCGTVGDVSGNREEDSVGGNIENGGTGSQISPDDKNLHGEVNELLTVEELADFHLNGDKYPENFVFEGLDGYGRVIGSASTAEDAVEVAKNHFTTDNCIVVETRSDTETDLYFGTYVKWRRRDESKYYWDEYVISFNKSVYDAESKKFFTDDMQTVKSVLNYLYYSRSYNWHGFKVYSADISLKENKLEYVAYLSIANYGDWGVQDEIYLIRSECHVDLATGELTYNHETVGTVFIDGELTHFGGVEE